MVLDHPAMFYYRAAPCREHSGQGLQENERSDCQNCHRCLRQVDDLYSLKGSIWSFSNSGNRDLRME